MLTLDHVGYLVRNVDEKKCLMEDLLGLRFTQRLIREQPENTNRLDFYECERGAIELVESSNPASSYNRFIDERGEGLHHIAFRVDDLQATMAEWEAKGVRFTLKPPLGASGSRRAIITFTDPVTTGGLVIELVQALKEGDENPDWVQL